MHESMVSGTYPNASVNVQSKKKNLRLTKCVSISLEGICSACTPNITPWARTGRSRLFCRQIGGGLFSRLLGSGLFGRLTGTRLLSTVWTVTVDVIALAGVFIYQNKFTQSCYHTQYLEFVLSQLSYKFQVCTEYNYTIYLRILPRLAQVVLLVPLLSGSYLQCHQHISIRWQVRSTLCCNQNETAN